ncbi:TPR repeat-containing protein [Cavenderia fasciculata]|uniref:TPR repeat-containing protein n=1 Tax=Cavenderia fasciculata TaxID=261658 RepID=F4Q8A6_CACFS|nr:TPR repeat-containing protein [Cavenderia fasciculata]EGG16006.1 TPR repeat-containing protein [Cavenderia fasciculata]|eukprot:XP_004352331.1 TPR repeat-containing protein [Cavenderia fasciculata]
MGCCCGKESKKWEEEEGKVPSNKKLQKQRADGNNNNNSGNAHHRDQDVQGGPVSVFKAVDPVKNRKDIIATLEDNPNDTDALTNYAIVLSAEGNDSEALVTLQKAVDIDPEKSRSWLAIAELYERKNDKQKAREVYEKSYKHASPKLALDGQDSDLLLNFAINCEKEGDYEKAEKLYKRVVTSGPTNTRGVGHYATFLANVRKDNQKANLYFKQIADQEPSVSYWCHQYALFLRDTLKDESTANIYFKKASLN